MSELQNFKLEFEDLTPLECERLQGFPDNFTRYGKDGEWTLIGTLGVG